MEILAGFELLAVVLQRIICQENLRGCIIQPTFFLLFHILYITAGDCNCTCSYDVVQLVHNFPVRN